MSEGVKTRAANFRELWPRVRDNPQCFVEDQARSVGWRPLAEMTARQLRALLSKDEDGTIAAELGRRAEGKA